MSTSKLRQWWWPKKVSAEGPRKVISSKSKNADWVIKEAAKRRERKA